MINEKTQKIIIVIISNKRCNVNIALINVIYGVFDRGYRFTPRVRTVRALFYRNIRSAFKNSDCRNMPSRLNSVEQALTQNSYSNIIFFCGVTDCDYRGSVRNQGLMRLKNILNTLRGAYFVILPHSVRWFSTHA